MKQPILLYVGRDDVQLVSPNKAFARQASDVTLRVLPTAAHGVDLARTRDAPDRQLPERR